MDVISLGKAVQTLRDIKELNDEILGKEAEKHFKTIDHRLDWIEGQADKAYTERSYQVEFSKGEANRLDLIDGSLKLKLVGQVISDIPESMARVNVSSTTSIYDFGENNEKIVNRVIVDGARQNLNGRLYALTSFRISGSNDGSNYTLLYTGSQGELNGVTHTFNNNTPYRYYKFHDILGYNRGSQIRGSFSLYGKGLVSSYLTKGVWESPIIDLGIGWKETKALNVIKQEMESANILLEVATSSDGVSFTDYETLTKEALPQARYLKIRATLSAQPIGGGEEVVYLFDQSTEENMVTLNKYVEANGQLKLKQDYNDLMNKDLSWVDEGSLHRKVVTRGEWKKINSISIR